jgi:hypothetical protein
MSDHAIKMLTGSVLAAMVIYHVGTFLAACTIAAASKIWIFYHYLGVGSSSIFSRSLAFQPQNRV